MMIPPVTSGPGLAPDAPIDHVARPPLPWRREDLTECGLPCAGHPVITREELIARVRKLGCKRAAFVTCMTCLETAGRHRTWEEDPVARMARETYGPGRYAHGKSESLRGELLALAELVSRHREEFAAILAGLGEAASLADARKARRRRA